MVLKHIRHVLSVYGEKKLFLGNEEYYEKITCAAIELSSKIGVPHSFKSGLLKDADAALCEITSPSRAYVDELAKRLTDLKMYKEVKVETQEIDIEKMAKEQGIDPKELEDLLD
jgi:hypothetical protein